MKVESLSVLAEEPSTFEIEHKYEQITLKLYCTCVLSPYLESFGGFEWLFWKARAV